MTSETPNQPNIPEKMDELTENELAEAAGGYPPDPCGTGTKLEPPDPCASKKR